MTPHPIFSPTSTALITGAASGIGHAIAQRCAKHGMKLALVDIQAENLATVASSLDAAEGSGAEVEVETFTADVSKLEDWKELKVKVGKRFGGVHLLVLNAGIGARGGWEDVGYFHKIFDTNLFGAINGIATFLPALQSGASATQPCAVVLTGSKQGITNPPGNPAYNASKAALKTVAEHLSFDLRENPHVSVHLLVPGWTFTGLTGGGRTVVKQKPDGAWEPAQVAEYLERKMGEGVFYVVCPDNDVSEEMDQRRMLWGAGDLVERRPPLSRWREDWKDRAKEGIEKMVLPGGK